MKKTVLSFFTILFATLAFAQPAKLTSVLQAKLDSLRIAAGFPGISAALVLPNNSIIDLVSGYSDTEKNIPLRTTHKLMQGSVGKTYAAAVAMQLVSEKKFSLDDKVARYLGHFDWYNKIPNAFDITIRMIMNHTSGVMRYEFKEAFTQRLTVEPDKYWKPEELLSYILGEPASFKAGEGWEYSDSNYILLGMIIEQITGKKYYDLVRTRILSVLRLQNTLPSDHRKLDSLSQAYAGEENDFGKKDKVISEDGNFVVNPQFEWTGGGIYSTTDDLANWGKLLYEGKAFDSVLLPVMLQGVPAKLGKDVQYGLGVIIHNTKLGKAYGHSGFFPGYLTEMLYFPDLKICVAVQVNSTDFKKIKTGPLRCLLEIASEYKKSLSLN